MRAFSLLLIFMISMPAYSAGDPVRGKQLAAECFACHGEDGNSPSPVNPKLGGQHELYLLMAMQAYVDGTRANSLMRGAVLNKSKKDLEDIAAYYASLGRAVPNKNASANPRSRGGVVKFDHGERRSAFMAMQARAMRYSEQAPRTLDDSVCRSHDGGSDGDADRDGLPDRFDAAPRDNAEFVVDANDDGYFEICNIHQLQAIATLGSADGTSTPLTVEQRRSRSYQLVSDLDAASIDNYQPIGDCGPTGNCMRALGQFGFSGVFDGQGHAIRGLRIKHEKRGGVGLFGVVADMGVVMHLRLIDAEISGRAGTGALVGSNFGTVMDCDVSASVSGQMAIGGLVGGSAGLVSGSRSSGSVTGEQAIGGLVGDMTGAVHYSSSESAVTGDRGVGGLVGLNTFGSVLGSRAAGSVTGSNDIGGLIGVNTDATVRISYATGAVDADANNVGGLVGFNSLSTIRNAFATGAVVGEDAVGGLVGRNNGVISRAYATGAVSGAGATGALVGVVVDGREESSYAGLAALTAESSGWVPAGVPLNKALDYFCDSNRNGFIDPAEATENNYIWSFNELSRHPSLACAVSASDKRVN